MCVCGGQRWTSTIVPDHSPPYRLRPGLSLESRVYKMALSSSPVCSRDPITACRVLGLQVAATPAWLFCRCWNLNSGPHACGQMLYSLNPVPPPNYWYLIHQLGLKNPECGWLASSFSLASHGLMRWKVCIICKYAWTLGLALIDPNST